MAGDTHNGTLNVFESDVVRSEDMINSPTTSDARAQFYASIETHTS